MSVLAFLEGPAGRILRSVAGIVLIAIAAYLGGAWWVLGVLGAVALAAGIGDVCLAAPLGHQRMHHPLRTR